LKERRADDFRQGECEQIVVENEKEHAREIMKALEYIEKIERRLRVLKKWRSLLYIPVGFKYFPT
jgi:hypothetical protein